MTEYQKKLVAQLRMVPLQDPPAPWRYVTFIHVGGLEAVGYGLKSDLLLTISTSGRSVIDCGIGEKVAREYTETPEDWKEVDWYHPVQLRAKGFGPLDGQDIPLAGIFGGGLPRVSEDYWQLDWVAPDWPNSFLLLRAPTEFVEGQRVPEVKVKVAPKHGLPDSIIAYGFSPTGQSFIAVMEDGVDIFSRISGIF